MTPPPTISAPWMKYDPLQTIAFAKRFRSLLSNHTYPHFAEPYPVFVPSLQKLDENVQHLENVCEEAKYRDTRKMAERDEAHKNLKDEPRGRW